MRGAVLQRLKLADQLAELLALLQIADGAAEYFFADADHFRRHRTAADVENAFQQCAALIDFAEHAVGVDLDIVEHDARGVVRIHHRGAFGFDALGFGIDQEQRQPVAFAGSARGARRDDQQIGGMAVDDEGLGAVQLEAIAGSHRLHFGLQRAVFCAFIDGERRQQRTIRDFGQMLGFLRGTSAAQQRRRREHGGRKKRRGHQRAADLLHHHAGLDAAEPAAAEAVGHQQAGKSHLGECCATDRAKNRWRPWNREAAADATPAPCR